MSKGAIISLVVSAVIGLLAVAATVSLNEATNNIASWSEPLFWVGIALIVVPMLFGIRTIYRRLTKRFDQTVPAAPPADHWAERQRLEISVLANLSAHREPNASPISGEPENSRLRELKDAIDTGELDAEINGDKPNVMSTVTLHDFTVYVAATNKSYWVEVLHRWQAVRNQSDEEITAELKRKRISLLEFIEMANERNWDILGPDAYEGLDLIHGISEAAGLGDLVILGKQMNRNMPTYTMAGRQQVIPSEFWQQRRIEPLSCFSIDVEGEISGLAAMNESTHTTSDHGDSPATINYSDLYVETDGLLDWLKNDADACRGHHSKTYGD